MLKEIIDFGIKGNAPNRVVVNLSKLVLAREYKNGNANTHICIDTHYHYWIKEPLGDVCRWLEKAGNPVIK
jgi:hypothetical protein